MFSSKNILVIAAHPDDEVLGCAGMIKRYATSNDIYIGVLGEGITSRPRYDKSDLDRLKAHCQQVGEFLGAKAVVNFNLPDNRFDSVPLLDVVKKIEQLKNKFQPDIVFTQHGGDLNIDHVITYRATLTAFRPMKDEKAKAIYAYSVNSSTEWAFGQFQPEFHPNVFVGIDIDHKIEAMQIYESETRDYPHPRSPLALRAQAGRWGSTVGLDFAEAFDLVWRRHA